MKYLYFKHKLTRVTGVMTIDSREDIELLKKKYGNYEVKLLNF